MAYQIINLKDIYNELGENDTKELLKNFKCPLNKDVEDFFKNKAIEFSKRDYSRTYIVVSSYKQENVIVGYFAIANKSTIIKKSILSKTKRKRFLALMFSFEKTIAFELSDFNDYVLFRTDTNVLLN